MYTESRRGEDGESERTLFPLFDRIAPAPTAIRTTTPIIARLLPRAWLIGPCVVEASSVSAVDSDGETVDEE